MCVGSWSKITATKLLATKEVLKIAPEIVANIDIVMTFVSLELEALNVPAVDSGRYLRVSVADVEAADTTKELSFLVFALPFSELPVLTVDEDSDDSGPARLREISHTIVDIEGDHSIANSAIDSDKLWKYIVLVDFICVRIFLIMSIFKEALDIGERYVSGHKHGRYYNDRMRSYAEVVCLLALIAL